MALNNLQKGFNELLKKRARIWVTTTVVLAAVAFYVMFQAVSGLSTEYYYVNQDFYNTSDAAILIRGRYEGRTFLSIIEEKFAIIKQVLSPSLPQAPATVTPAATDNNVIGGGASTGNTSTTASVNNPSIFTQQNQGPSAPKLTIGARFSNVSPEVGWAVQGRPADGEASDILKGKDYAALSGQWTQYYAASNPSVINAGGGSPRPPNCPDIRVFVDWGDGKTSWLGRAKGQDMTPVSGSRPTDLIGNSDCGQNFGGANESFNFAYEYNSAGRLSPHVYASTGVYTVTTKACYESGLPLPSDQIIRNPGAFNWTSPLDGRCSSVSRATVTVVTPEVGLDPIEHATSAYPALGADNLLVKLAPNQPNEKKNPQGYPVYKVGNNIPMGITRIINIGIGSETLNSIAISPSGLKLPERPPPLGRGTCCHVSIDAVRMKMNGGVIGEISMQWSNPTVGAEVMRFSQPIMLSIGQSLDLHLYGDAHVDEGFLYGSGTVQGGTCNSSPRQDDIFQWAGIAGLNRDSSEPGGYVRGSGGWELRLNYKDWGRMNLGNFEIDNCGNTPGSIATQ